MAFATQWTARAAGWTGGKDRGIFGLNPTPERSSIRSILAIAQLEAFCLPSRQCRSGPLSNEPALLLGQSGVEVQHEWIGVGPEFGDDERHTLGHEPGYEGHVAG